MESTECIIIDFDNECFEQSIMVTQYDTGKKVRCHIKGTSGNVGLAMVYCRKPSGLETYTNADVVDDHTVEFYITQQMNAEIGETKCQLQLFGDDKSLTSYKFKMRVRENMIANSRITSTDEYTAFLDAVSKLTGTDAELSDEIEVERAERKSADELEKAARMSDDAVERNARQTADAEERAERKQEIAIERARIDNLITANNPTEGNSELLDIRVGDDGTVYSSAGEAVRSQIKNTLYSMKNIISTEQLADFNDAEKNKIYMISASGIKHSPLDGVGMILSCLSANDVIEDGYCAQVAQTVASKNIMFIRSQFNKAWNEWDEIITKTALDERGYTKYAFRLNPENVDSIDILSDTNNAKANTLYMISHIINNTPDNIPGMLSTLSNYADSYEMGGWCAQQYNTIGGGIPRMYIRYCFSDDWVEWERIVTEHMLSDEINKIEDKIDSAKIECSISLFETIGIVGDSYASGVIYSDSDNFVTKYNKSWGQILARETGCIVTNFSEGGLSTRSWLTSNKGLPLLKSEAPKELYILCLGINDWYHLGDSYLGTLEDITSHENYTDYGDTFYGNYGKIIENIKEKAPDCFMIMSTIADSSRENFNEAIENIAEHYALPIIKQHADNYFQSDFYKNNMIGGHPTAINYSGMAKALRRMIEQCLKDNVEYFKQAFSN